MTHTLPNLWSTSNLGTVLSRSDERIDPLTANIKDTFYVALEHIESNTGILTNATSSTDEELRSTKNIFHAGDILYGKLRPYLNKVYIADRDGICSTDIWVFKPTSVVNPIYATYYLRSSSVLQQVSQLSVGANLPRIDAKSFDKIPIPLPPLPEQHRIAAILHQADKIRKMRRQAREKVESFYRILFHDFFEKDQVSTDETVFIKLKDLLATPLTSGFSPEGKDEPPGVPVFTLSAITDVGLDATQVKYYRVENYHGRGEDLQVNDILITRSNTLELVGKVARYLGEPFPVIYPDLTIRIRLKDVKDSAYVENFLRSDRMQAIIRRTARGTSGSMKKISQGDINEFDILWPSQEKRHTYARFVEEIDQQRALQVTAQRELDTLYQSLLAQAFTGELTASWRTAHTIELTQEARRRDELLRELRATAPTIVTPQPIQKNVVEERSELAEELTALQRALLALIDHSPERYFPATGLHEEITAHLDEDGRHIPELDKEGLYLAFAGLDCSLDTIRRDLHYLAALGLLKDPTLRIEDEGSPLRFITGYRSLLADDDSQQQDLDVLEEIERESMEEASA